MPAGFWLAVAAQTMWGCLPLYYTLIKDFSPTAIIAIRVIASLVTLIVWVFIAKKYIGINAKLLNKKVYISLIIGGALLLANWLIYIYALSIGRVLEGSLGYFIYPLFNIAIGFIVFGDRFNGFQKIAVALAFVAVLYLCFFYGYFPWIGLMLAATFSFYGALRKYIGLDSMQALAIEVFLYTPLAFVLLYFQLDNISSVKAIDWLWVAFIGPYTVISLVMFVKALGTLNLAFAGMISYLGPFLQFLSGLYLGEKLNLNKLIAFVLIWLAIAIYYYGIFQNAKVKKAISAISEVN